MNRQAEGPFAAFIGLTITQLSTERVVAEMKVREQLTNRKTDRPQDHGRRRWMHVALCGAAALAAGPAQAQRKLTKQEAEYQDKPVGGIMMCGTCTLFEPPAGCKVMEGDVAVTGWCKLFDLAD